MDELKKVKSQSPPRLWKQMCTRLIPATDYKNILTGSWCACWTRPPLALSEDNMDVLSSVIIRGICKCI